MTLENIGPSGHRKEKYKDIDLLGPDDSGIDWTRVDMNRFTTPQSLSLGISHVLGAMQRLTQYITETNDRIQRFENRLEKVEKIDWDKKNEFEKEFLDQVSVAIEEKFVQLESRVQATFLRIGETIESFEQQLNVLIGLNPEQRKELLDLQQTMKRSGTSLDTLQQFLAIWESVPEEQRVVMMAARMPAEREAKIEPEDKTEVSGETPKEKARQLEQQKKEKDLKAQSSSEYWKTE